MSRKSAARERTIRRVFGRDLSNLERLKLPGIIGYYPLYEIKSMLNMRQKQTAKKAGRVDTLINTQCKKTIDRIGGTFYA